MDVRWRSNETLERKLLPNVCPDRQERARAWDEWQQNCGEAALLKFIRIYNTTCETDEDIFQEVMLTAYLAVESGRYRPQEGIPFTAYVKGIARNKIRQALRQARGCVALDDVMDVVSDAQACRIEADVEHRERQVVLWRCLATLPGDRRRVIEHFLSGEDTREIADHLAISAELVRQHKSRGIRQLQARLAEGEAVVSRKTGEGMWTGNRVPACSDDLTEYI